MARALRFQANLPASFWGECVLTTEYLINRTPLSLLDSKSPYELLYSTPPNYNTLRVFSCFCYIHNHTSDKFNSRSRKCSFVGCPFNKQGWRLLLSLKNFNSRNVVFYENIFCFQNPIPTVEIPQSYTTTKTLMHIILWIYQSTKRLNQFLLLLAH